MMNEKIDYEKDHLVIYRKKGKFYRFSWAISDYYTPEKIGEFIKKYNESEQRKDDHLVTELITDPLVREICAYREACKPYLELLDKAQTFQNRIDKSMGLLESAMFSLGNIERLD
jgi:hypothetical protein